jgi:probable rRNA maturation factor
MAPMAPRPVHVRILPGCRGLVTAAELRRVARHVLAAEGVQPAVEVEVVLADGQAVRDLNRLYRGRDEETDVLSFAESESPSQLSPRGGATASAFVEPPDSAPSLGQVVLCAPVLRRQAEDGDHPPAGVAAHLLAHGLLHLLGYDHEASEEEARLMQEREDELLAELGYAGAYEHATS